MLRKSRRFSVSRIIKAIASTHRAYPQRDGQAELNYRFRWAHLYHITHILVSVSVSVFVNESPTACRVGVHGL